MDGVVRMALLRNEEERLTQYMCSFGIWGLMAETDFSICLTLGRAEKNKRIRDALASLGAELDQAKVKQQTPSPIQQLNILFCFV
jgi:hypothetical protein